MQVYAEWDVSVEKNATEAILVYDFKRVYGYVEFGTKKDNFREKRKVDFETNADWDIGHIPYCSDKLSPTSCIINFDINKLTIKF